jgi:hypothetical protein
MTTTLMTHLDTLTITHIGSNLLPAPESGPPRRWQCMPVLILNPRPRGRICYWSLS